MRYQCFVRPHIECSLVLSVHADTKLISMAHPTLHMLDGDTIIELFDCIAYIFIPIDGVPQRAVVEFQIVEITILYAF